MDGHEKPKRCALDPPTLSVYRAHHRRIRPRRGGDDRSGQRIGIVMLETTKNLDLRRLLILPKTAGSLRAGSIKPQPPSEAR
jgi:hypothetical protein